MKKPIPFGKYYLLERINVGGMAEVFRSKAYGVEGFERLVAVKRILPNIAEDKDFIKMFIDEAKISVQLNHANIAQIFDLGVVDGSYYIALEHVHGRDLRAIFDRCRTLGEPMPVAQACFVVMKVCEGLDYAHNKRDQAGKELHLVHRDVSPQNVLTSFEGEVKLIDFGIAKAAGKGAKTQAGILKGKFGYMSPEQVRGLPIDRRSDIFSCGIVLYELLTGERLFVGESDFSTLEKVRNVEILPPSTYNRKIPDELERIVLKALAKDVEDRYQNAIDLHDELQAFVYTAGEFYSRKDLAGWMKRTFAKEIDEETAKLESYRQLKPPTEPPKPALTAPPPATKPPPLAPSQRRTTSMGAVSGGPSGTKPPPPPVRTSQQMPILAAPPSAAPAAMSAAPAAAASVPKIQTRGEDDLSWDDDELETQIYDEPPAPGEDGKVRRPTKTGVAVPAPGGTLEGVAAAAAEPDLSSLVSTAKGWDKAPVSKTGPATTLTGMGPPPVGDHYGGAPTNGRAGGNGASVPLPGLGLPVGLAAGSNQAPSPYASDQRESAAIASLVATPTPATEPVFDLHGNIVQPPSSTFGSGMLGARKPGGNKTLFLVAGGIVVLAGAAVAIVLETRGGDDKKTDTPAGSGAPVATAPQATGFDLYVTPNTVTRWRLDDEVRTDKLSSGMKIRNIAPGIHQLHIEAPAGYVSESRQIEVVDGQAPKIEINLSPVEVVGRFDSTPPGANVFLLVDGQRVPLGPAPATGKLDPRKSYQVLFEKPEYVSKNMPVTIANGEAVVSAVLDKADAVAVGPTPPDGGGGRAKPPGGGGRTKPPGGGSDGGSTKPPGGGTDGGSDGGSTKPPGGGTDGGTKPPGGGTDGGTKPPEVKGEGTLMITSKPPCDIFVDGKDMGVKTPQREMKLPAGKHKITLANNEYSIRETFWVEIKPNDTTKASKDFMDKVSGGGSAPAP